MTLFANTGGLRKAFGTKLTTTAATTLLTGTADLTYTIDAIHWAVDTGGSTLSIWWSEGGIDYYLVELEAEPANSRDSIKDIHIVLRNGMTLKAQAGTASKVDITTVAIQSMKTQSE